MLVKENYGIKMQVKNKLFLAYLNYYQEDDAIVKLVS